MQWMIAACLMLHPRDGLFHWHCMYILEQKLMLCIEILHNTWNYREIETSLQVYGVRGMYYILFVCCFILTEFIDFHWKLLVLLDKCDGGQCVECESDYHCSSNQYCKNKDLPYILNKCTNKKSNGQFCLQDRVSRS